MYMAREHHEDLQKDATVTRSIVISMNDHRRHFQSIAFRKKYDFSVDDQIQSCYTASS